VTSAGVHTILGANGAVGRALSRELAAHALPVRQVARRPHAESPTDTLVAADLLDARATERAVAGSAVAYLLVGLPYVSAVWQADWPRLMHNVIEACVRHNTRLVFFDNVYAYGAVRGLITEETPFNPCSRKGEIRARVATSVLEAMHSRQLRAQIVRSADFYYAGEAGATGSLLNSVVFERLRSGKAAQWLGSPDVPYSATYCEDIARSLHWLAARPECDGQTWHALTSAEPVTGRSLVALAAELLGRRATVRTAPRWMVRLLGTIQPTLREQLEMLYQYENPYQFASGKLEGASGLTPTSYRHGFAHALGCVEG
jgi:nucleoside-diphosphate-sugar epimerase